jgi:flagellar biosynthesis/type III secretory pathway ATPase|tara:strand:- start:4729 stop:4908 length:180 start_codon:yes stop_codon:yes gene_type:complete
MIPKAPKKMLEAMKSISRGSKPRPIIMEVIGEKGEQVAEYVDKEDQKPKRYHLVERYTI